MEQNFNVDRRFKIYSDKLTSIHANNNLIIETSNHSIDFSCNTLIFDGQVVLNRVICNNISISNVSEISSNFVYVNNIYLPENIKLKYNSVNDGYIRNISVGYSPQDDTLGRSDAYFTYINVSGGDSSFNTNLYINKNLIVDGTLTISNDLLINGTNFTSIENSFNIYKSALEQSFSSTKIFTKDVSTTNVSISNNLYVLKTAYINDISINGQLLNSVLKVPNIFTIDPSGHGNASGTLIINGDLIVKGVQTSIASSIVDICDLAITLASNLANRLDLSNANAGLDISNVASLKYNGTTWNFSGGQLTVENKKVMFLDDVSSAKRNFDLSVNAYKTDFSSSFFTLKRNIDNSYNATYTRFQIDNSFILRSNFDLSLTSLRSYVDSSYISKRTFDGSFQNLLTLMDTSYVAQRRVGTLNSFDSSFATFTEKLDMSYILNSVFDASHNSLKTRFDISFATISATNIEASSIIIETINTKHSSQMFANSLWNQIGVDISNGPPLANNNKKIAVSNDGKVVAFASSAFASSAFASSGFVSTASGGTITISGGYAIHRFDASGTFTPYFSGNVEVLLVGGGGGGGPTYSGGGGGGGVVYITSSYVTSDTSYSVVIGSGGASGTKGYNTTVFGATAAGGGTNLVYDTNGTIGGCGGGAGASQWRINIGGESSGNIIGINNGIANVGFIYGCSGGNTTTIRYGDPIRAAGGGGAGAQGAATDTQSIGDRGQFGHGSGGIGINNSILGTSYYWGGGGGGSAYIDQSGGYGGYGGGGGGSGNAGGGRGGVLAVTDGSNGGLTMGGPGGANTGGGGGGGRLGGGAGGSGIVVIRYLQITSDISKGRIYVYELSYNQPSYIWRQLGLSSEILVGVSNDDQFGWDIALSSDGRVVAGSLINSDASGINCGQVRLFELSNNTNRWLQKGLNINGARPGSESGYSISLAGNGNSIAIGAWKDNSNGTNSGAVRVYDFSANVNDWRQKGQTIAGVSGSFEGYATALSLDGQTLASASILPGLLSISGGTVSTSSGYIIHSFTNVGTTPITVTSPVSIDYLVIAGGASGGVGRGGGGGAGGVKAGTTTLTAGSYTITVGFGGPSVTGGDYQGNDGGSSSIGTLIVTTGGGGGGGWNTTIGRNGGSGGGSSSGNTTAGGTGIAGQGFAGSARLDTITGGGGGGAGAAASGKDGAIGISSNITGTIRYYAGGGGAAADHLTMQHGIAFGGIYAVANGTYGGGNGATTTGTKQPFQDAVANTGGGGGAHTGGTTSGAGGSGIVILRYLAKSGSVKTFTISGTTWNNKGSINGIDISFGRAIKLSTNGNTIAIGSPGYGEPITPTYELNSTIQIWEWHRTNALTVPGRSLASISNPTQNEQVRLMVSRDTWIGGKRKVYNTSDKTSATWEWTNGDPWIYYNWDVNEPGSLEDNVKIQTSGYWHDYYNNPSWTTEHGPAVYMNTLIPNVGQAYVYGFQGGTTWRQLGQTIYGISGGDEFGSSVSMSNDGTIIAVGSDNNSSNRGHVRVFVYANNYWYQLSNAIDGKTVSSKAGTHALSGDGATLIQSNNTYNSVYGINKTLTLIPSTTTINTTISGDLIVGGKGILKSFRISNKHIFDVSVNGYSSNYLATTDVSASIVEYYSNVGYTYNRVFRIDACGNVSNYSGLYGAVSDSRLKENIVTSSPKLEDLLKVRVVNYNLKGSDKTKYIGLIAQELEELFPELVAEDNTYERIKSVNYSTLTIMLIKAFQEQQVLINNLNMALEDLDKYLEKDLEKDEENNTIAH